MSWSVANLVCILFTSPPHPNTRDEDVGDESGWKQIKGDVFRSPPRLLLFSALVGTGTLLVALVAICRLVYSYRLLLLPIGHQLVILVFCLLCLAALGTYYAQRGTVVTAFIICYALTSFIAGYGGGGYYARNGGKKWIKCTRCKNAHSFSLSDCSWPPNRHVRDG